MNDLGYTFTILNIIIVFMNILSIIVLVLLNKCKFKPSIIRNDRLIDMETSLDKMNSSNHSQIDILSKYFENNTVSSKSTIIYISTNNDTFYNRHNSLDSITELSNTINDKQYETPRIDSVIKTNM